jgi:colanic acid biosynthesis glycosyl transferase WcaI
MSHILFLTPYYPPEIGAPQTRISETAVRLVKRGHRVTVLTTLPNYPSGVVPEDYRSGKQRREVVDGVNVVRVWSYIRPNKGTLGRIVAQLSFGCLAPVLGGRAIGHPDIIIIESPPLFDTIGGRLLSRFMRCPYILTVADIWPESAVQLGLLRNRLAIWLAERLEWSSYQHAAAVWAVTRGIHQTLVQRGLRSDQLFFLPNGVDTAAFCPHDKTQARAQLGWDGRFTVLYAGTLGLAHGLSTVLDAAKRLRAYPDIRIILMGDGAARGKLEAEARQHGLDNVTFLSSYPHDLMPLVVSASDVCLVSLRRMPIFEGALPSKMYEAMASARPMLLAVDGEARRLIVDQARAAIYVEPENPIALAEAILSLFGRRDLAAELGQHGRAFVEMYFDRDKLTAQLDDQIRALMDGAGQHQIPAGARPGAPGARSAAGRVSSRSAWQEKERYEHDSARV